MATTQIKNGFQGGTDDQLKVNTDGSINVNSSGSGGNASVGSNNSTAPASSTQIGGIDPNGNLQAVKIDSAGELITNGTAVPAGLRTAGRITTMLVGTSATELPAVALTNRNALSVTNLSNVTLYIGFSAAVTADSVVGLNSGWEIGPNEGFNIDITNNIPIYGIVASGSITIKVMELS